MSANRFLDDKHKPQSQLVSDTQWTWGGALIGRFIQPAQNKKTFKQLVFSDDELLEKEQLRFIQKTSVSLTVRI